MLLSILCVSLLQPLALSGQFLLKGAEHSLSFAHDGAMAYLHNFDGLVDEPAFTVESWLACFDHFREGSFVSMAKEAADNWMMLSGVSPSPSWVIWGCSPTCKRSIRCGPNHTQPHPTTPNHTQPQNTKQEITTWMEENSGTMKDVCIPPPPQIIIMPPNRRPKCS